MVSNVRSSLTYQVLLHWNRVYSTFLFFALVLLFFYKGAILPYQNHIRIMDFLILLCFAPIEAVRIAWGTRGNLTETPGFVAFSLFLGAPLIAICVYWAGFQSYVLLIEMILVCIEGGLIIFESIIGLALCATLPGSTE